MLVNAGWRGGFVTGGGSDARGKCQLSRGGNNTAAIVTTTAAVIIIFMAGPVGLVIAR